MNSGERSRLIDALIENEISESDFLRLEAEMLIDHQVREEYYARSELAALLESMLDTETVPVVETSRSWFASAPLGWAAAAAVVMLFGLYALLPHASSSREGALEEKLAAGFGVVVGQVDAEWADGRILADGDLLPAGELTLKSGAAQIDLFSGVSVILEGSTRFEVVSSMEVNLAAGKMRARVPEAAHGFLVNSPEGQVVDLGTEFALDVVAGQSVVHVLEGEIEWHPHDQSMQRLDGGEAISYTAAGELTPMTADASAFIGVDEISARLNSSRNAQFEQWQEYAVELRSDPRLVVHYSMKAPDRWSRRLANTAVAGLDQVGEGAVVAAAGDTDRWGRAGHALDFSPTGSRVRTVVPGEYRSMTFLTWVKINSLDRWYNSLFLTDGHELHEPHWQIMDDGRLFFSVKKRDVFDSDRGEQAKYNFYSPSFWNTSLSGQWLMLATVYDVDTREVTHHLNGTVLSRESIPEEYLVETVKIGGASIGNWGLPYSNEPAFAVRNLNGSMDEFAIFAAALSDDEIAEIYHHGKP